MATLIGEAASHVTTRARRRALVAGYYASFAASISRTEPDLPLNDPEELAAERETLRGVGLPPLRLQIIGTLSSRAPRSSRSATTTRSRVSPPG